MIQINSWKSQALSRILGGAFKQGAVPTHAEFADRILLPDGPMAGKPWAWRDDPAQYEIVTALDEPEWNSLVVVGPRQTGKTLSTVLLPLTRATVGAGQSAIYGLPTLDDLDKSWETKLRPAIDGSGFSKYLPKSGPGSRGGRGFGLTLVDPDLRTKLGTLLFVAGDGYGSTVPVVVIDEMDWFSKGQEPQVGAIKNIFACANSFDARKLSRRIAASTVEWDSGSTALAMLAESTDGRLYFKCPECDRYQRLAWSRVWFEGVEDSEVRDSARYVCEHCDTKLDDEGRRLALRSWKYLHRGQDVDEKGNVLGPRSRSESWGLLWTGLESTLLDMGTLAVEYNRAQRAKFNGDHEPARKFSRMRECAPYLSDVEEMEAGTELTWQNLLHRSMSAKWGVAIHSTDRSPEMPGYTYSRHAADPPANAAFVVGGIDVQQNRIYLQASAYAMDGTSWDIAWAYQYARQDQMPWNKSEIAQLLTAQEAWLRPLCKSLPLVAIGVDTGDFTDDLLSFLNTQRGGIWRSTKGSSGNLKDEQGDVPGLVHQRNGLLMLNIDGLRSLIHSAYRRPDGQPGSFNLPSGLKNNSTNTAYLRHLVAEMEIFDVKTKKTKVRHGPGRWDWHDARRITHAMALWHLKREAMRASQPQRQYGVIKTSL